MSKLILIRGLPGSGKSTLAKILSEDLYTVHHEADMYHIDHLTGEYKFDVNKIIDAHEWCQKITDNALKNGATVVVSNTFTTIKELRPYFELAKKYNIVPTVIHCQNQFKNVHNVPEETLKKMKNRFQHDISELFN